MIEKIARAICEAEGYNPDHKSMNENVIKLWQSYIPAAEAVLKAIIKDDLRWGANDAVVWYSADQGEITLTMLCEDYRFGQGDTPNPKNVANSVCASVLSHALTYHYTKKQEL